MQTVRTPETGMQDENMQAPGARGADKHAIEVRNVGYRITTGLFSRPRWLLRHVSFCVPSGGALALIGANGAGKTTLLKALLGTLLPHEGDAYLFGHPSPDPAARAGLGFMPERSPFAPSLAAGEIMLLHARLAGLDKRTAAHEIAKRLRHVGLTQAAGQRVSTFSKGMLQRLALAQALLGQPRLLILDEPMSGLDPDGRMLLRDLLLEQRSRGVTLLFSSHALVDVDLLADTVVMLERGRVIHQGDPRDVLAAGTSNIEIIAAGTEHAATLRAHLPDCRIVPHPRHTICEVASNGEADQAVDLIRQGAGRVMSISRRPAGARAHNGAEAIAPSASEATHA